MTEMDRQKVVDTAVHKSRDNRGHRVLYVLVGVAVLGVLVLFIYAAAQRQHSDDLTAQVGELATQQAQAAVAGQQLAAQLKGLGIRPTVTPPTPVTGAPGAQGQPGPGPSQADIDAAVSAYFTTHPLPPGQLPPVSEVAGLVAQYLVANPPAPGQDATPQMVSDAVTGYCTARNGCAGPAGQNATDDQVAAQVSTYCAAHNDCAGPTGATGATGQPGTNGQNGSPAQTETYSYQDGLVETCTRESGSPDTAPTYSCSQTTPPTGLVPAVTKGK